jgi:anti-sigma factor ChrR (cupin superfamily)
MIQQTDAACAELAPLYCLGTLDAHEMQQFEAHLATGCDVCAAEVRSFDPVRVSLAACPTEAAPSPAIRARLVDFLHAAAQPAAGATTTRSVVAPEMLKVRAHEGEWHELAPGVTRKFLFADSQRGTVTSLIKLRPGAQIPTHHHTGVEECLIVEGDMCSGDEVFNAGDYVCAPADSVHEHLYTVNGALLFIVAGGAATI